jgi:endonuclease/exonuclease/phosphatase family metal-dependent hydrolase
VLRLLSYNVHRWGDDREALARVIRACAPDVAMIQEAPTWWGTRRRRLAFAGSVGLTYVAGAARTAALVADPHRWTVTSRRVWRPVVRRWKGYATLQLPGGAVGLSGRIAGGRTLSVVGCHLGLSASGRRHELRQVLGLAGRLGSPVVVVGDINEDVGGPVWEIAAGAGLADIHARPGGAPAPTFPARGPHRRIDVVWATPGLSIRPVEVTELGLDRDLLVRASDHLPVLVEIDDADRAAG